MGERLLPQTQACMGCLCVFKSHLVTTKCFEISECECKPLDGRLWPRCLIVVYCPLKMASLLSSHSAAWMYRWETWVGGHSHTQPAPRAQLHPRQESSPSSNALYSGTCAHQSPLCLPQWPTLESCLSYLQHALDAEPPSPE